jgi:hypothetical protein
MHGQFAKSKCAELSWFLGLTSRTQDSANNSIGFSTETLIALIDKQQLISQ